MRFLSALTLAACAGQAATDDPIRADYADVQTLDAAIDRIEALEQREPAGWPARGEVVAHFERGDALPCDETLGCVVPVDFRPPSLPPMATVSVNSDDPLRATVAVLDTLLCLPDGSCGYKVPFGSTIGGSVAVSPFDLVAL